MPLSVYGSSVWASSVAFQIMSQHFDSPRLTPVSRRPQCPQPKANDINRITQATVFLLLSADGVIRQPNSTQSWRLSSQMRRASFLVTPSRLWRRGHSSPLAPFSIRIRYVPFWQRRPGRWRLAASASSIDLIWYFIAGLEQPAWRRGEAHDALHRDLCETFSVRVTPSHHACPSRAIKSTCEGVTSRTANLSYLACPT